MSRRAFGGDVASFVVTIGAASAALIANRNAVVTMWNAATGGTQYTDLKAADGTTSITSVAALSDGLLPQFFGPNGVAQMWANAPGAAERVLLLPTDANGSYVQALSVVKYGAVGDYDAVGGTGTDSTSAFQAAINEIAGYPATSRPYLFVPAGTYKISGPLTGIPSNLRIIGTGKTATRLCYTGTGIMFDLGTFNASPANPWVGTITGFTLESMLVDVPNTTYASEGSRVPTCIRDNGNGSVTLRGTKIAGFAYGFNAAYGSDFTVCDAADFYYNDVGVYLGPGSEQDALRECQFFGNREALVIERSVQGLAQGCQFIDSSVADITVVYNSTATRSGVSVVAGYNFSAWNFEDNWHESNADGLGTRIPPQHILTTGDTAGYPQWVSVRRPYLVSGGTASASNAFWRNSQGTRHILDGLIVYGAQIKYAVDAGATAPKFIQRNTKQTDGWTGLVLWNGESATCYTVDDYLSYRAGPAGAVLRSWRRSGDSFDRVQITADGKVLIGDATQIPPGSIQALSAAVTGLGGTGWRVTPPNNATVPLDIFGTGTMGVPYHRWRNSAGTTLAQIDQNGRYQGAIWTKAGTPVDGDFANAQDGLVVVDTTASKLWLRIGGVWKSAAFV